MVNATTPRTDEQAILEDGRWADCYICEHAFRRRRQTKRFCKRCKRAFCEGEHGNFAYGFGSCVFCGMPKAMRAVPPSDPTSRPVADNDGQGTGTTQVNRLPGVELVSATNRSVRT